MNELRRARTSVGELAYRDLGDPEAPAVVLIHGFPTSSHLWRHLAPLLSVSMRVLVPDLMGAGDSDKPEAPLGLPAQARYLREWLTGIGVGRFAVVGHGIGGGVAQLLAAEGGVAALVLIDAAAFDAWPSEAVREAQAHSGSGSADLVAAAVGTAFELGMRRRSLAEADLAEYVRPFAGRGGAYAFSRWLLALDGRGLEDAAARIAEREIPTLVLWGEDDPFFPSAVAERLGDAIATASVALLPGCGHFLPEEAPETVGPLVAEFLRARYLGRPHEHPAGPVRVELLRRRPTDEGGGW